MLKCCQKLSDPLSTCSTGKFRHLPVVENGEVIALLDITKCLYDAISRMEKAAEQGSAIAAAVEGVERQMGNNFAGWIDFFSLSVYISYWYCERACSMLSLLTHHFSNMLG